MSFEKKINSCFFDSASQIRQLIKDEHFIGKMTELENNARFCTEIGRIYTEIIEELQNAWLQHEYEIAFFILLADFLETG